MTSYSVKPPAWYTGSEVQYQMLSVFDRRVAYRKAHREQVSASKKTWSTNNLERAKVYSKKWRVNNVKALADGKRKWRVENPNKQVIYSQKYRAKKQQEFNELFGIGSVIY
jgi:hypothetical protein